MDILSEIESWVRVAKGDTPGHPFRGNQYAEGLADRADELSRRAASEGSSRDITREHEDLSDQHAELSTRNGDAHSLASDAHAEAAETHHLATNGRSNEELRYGQRFAAQASEDAAHASAVAAGRVSALGRANGPTTYIGGTGTPSTIGQEILSGTPPTPPLPAPVRQDPDEGEVWLSGRPHNVTAADALQNYEPAGSSNGDRGKNVIAGMTSSRLEDLRLAVGSLSHLADMKHGYASTRVRGELGSIREAIQNRLNDLKNEARAGGSRFVRGEGNQPTRTAADYKGLIRELTDASKAVSGLRSGWAGKNNPRDFSNGHFAQNAPAVARQVREALKSYEEFYAGTDGKDTGYFGNDHHKKSAPTRFVITIAGDVTPR